MRLEPGTPLVTSGGGGRRPRRRDRWREAGQEGPGWAGPELRSTSRGEESWAPRDDAAAETCGGKPAKKAPAGPDQSYEARAALGRGEVSWTPVSDSRLRLGAACCGVNSPGCLRGSDDPAAETGGGKPARKAQAGPDQSYEARAELGRDAESWMPVSASR
ncbi:hypothetical protein NDU88_001886 [Pleurodeles waltl]|uniref:Uncharacterized protein n=1 Tax=Pleurodeles waltl TaxID=8319 RepID=A0AAV7MMS4_PLEWA|nr:hypothetical protein NDU88_001886 [Pleurodeles waltl]